MIIRYLNFLFIILFALSAIAQYNDPDPFSWVLIYAAASLVSLLHVFGKLNWILAASVAFIAFIWALTILPDLRTSGFVYIFDELQMRAIGVKDAREFSGLLIIFLWTGLLAMLGYRAKYQRLKSA